jgi:hypothetical protein
MSGLQLFDTSTSVGAPEWLGWLVLCSTLGLFGALLWWLLLSPLPGGGCAPSPGRPGPSRPVLAGLIVLSGLLVNFGARWDELWHRIYGVVGNDFLWPPHLMIYGALGLNAGFAALGLATSLAGHGGLRERFRADPLLGLLGLLGAYGIATVPSDLIWHRIIGPDITAWSLPHLLLAANVSAVLLAGAAIALSAAPDRRWRSVLARPGGSPEPAALLAIGLVGLALLALLLIGATEYEWGDHGQPLPAVYLRPAWAYPVAVLLVGAACAHVALHATRQVGAATGSALVALGLYVPWVLVARAELPPGPKLVSHLLLVAPALALDAWYALRRGRADRLVTQAVGAALYGAVLLAVMFPYLAWVGFAPPLGGPVQLQSALIGLPATALVSVAFARVGAWLGGLGRPPVSAAARQPVGQPHPATP